MGAMLVSSCRSQVPKSALSGVDRGKLMLSVVDDSHSSTLRILDLNDYSFTDFKVPLARPHSMNQNLNNLNDVFLYEFMGGAAKFDLETFKGVHISPVETFFAGHAVQDGDTIWCTEKYMEGDRYCFARNASDLSLIPGKEHKFDAGHHIVKMPGSSLVVSGSHGFVTFFDIKTKKVHRKISIDRELTPVHFIPLSETEVVAVGGVMKGKLDSYFDLSSPAPSIYATTSGEVRTFWDESLKDDFRFGFGLKKLAGNSWLTGHKLGDAVFLWKDYKIVKKFEMKNPQAISLTKDGTQFIVHSGDNLNFYSFKTYELEKTIAYDRPIQAISEYTPPR